MTGGRGAQSKLFAEYGARHIIMMDLSHSVDDGVHRNLVGLKSVDVIQCSIDAPPLLDQPIDGIVYCHNVIQHTPSVEKTAQSDDEIRTLMNVLQLDSTKVANMPDYFQYPAPIGCALRVSSR